MKLKAVLAAIAVAGAALFGFLSGLFFGNKTSASSEAKASDAMAKKEAEIEKTPAPELVAHASNADELRRDADSIKARLRERVKDRVDQLDADGLGSDPTSRP